MISPVLPKAKLLRKAIVATALLLGACENAEFGSGERAPVVAPATVVPPPPPAPRVVRASPPRAPAVRDAIAEIAPATPPAEVAALPQRDDPALPPAIGGADEVRPQAVVGLTENALVRWLGPPANSREEPPARIWRYEGTGCALDVFLYLDLVSREFRALRHETKGSENDDQRCLRPVFAGRGPAPHATARRSD